MVSKPPKKALTMQEILDNLENESSDEDDIHTVTVLPPDNVHEATDEEDLDDDIIAINDNISAGVEVAGQLEYETRQYIEGTNDDKDFDDVSDCGNSMNDVQPSTSSAKPATIRKSRAPKRTPQKIPSITYKTLDSFGKPKWTKRKNKLPYNIRPVPEPLQDVQQKLYNDLKDLTPIELFYKFFDDEVFSLIIEQTLTYAAQKNNTKFVLDTVSLKRFLGILILSGYHTLPSIGDYWSEEPTLGLPIVKQAMSRNRFRDIKTFLHICDNNNLDPADKLTKVY